MPLESDVYWMIEHSSLHEVLALVEARDSVRAIPEDPACPFYDTEPMPNSTTRVPARRGR